MFKKLVPLLLLTLPFIIAIEECSPPLLPPLPAKEDRIILQGVELIFSFANNQLTAIQAIDHNDNVAATVKIGKAIHGNQWGRMLFNKTLKLSALLPNKENIKNGPLIGEKLLIEITFKRLRPWVKKPANIFTSYILGFGNPQKIL